MTYQTIRKARKLATLLVHPMFRRGLRHRVAAATEHRDVIRSLKIGTIIDVGANIGQFSLLARAFHPTVHIYAFEPLPLPAARFARLFAEDDNISLQRLAAGETAGLAPIHVSGRPDSSSLLPITELQDLLFPGTAQSSTAQIQVIRIDDALKDAPLLDPIFIKLDVQGFELSALKGMPLILQRSSHVYAEVSFKELYKGQPLAHEIIQWLHNADFFISGVCNPTVASDGSTIQADILFTKRKSAT